MAAAWICPLRGRDSLYRRPLEAVPLGGSFIGPSWSTRKGGSFICRGAGTNASLDREEVPTKQGLVWGGGSVFFPLPVPGDQYPVGLKPAT